MEGGGGILRTENKAQCHVTGVNPKLGVRRQTLVDLSNIVREDRNSVICENSYAEVVKENALLMKNIGEKSKLIEVYEQEVEKLKIALQGARQQNWQLAETNSQMLAELNLGKDRLKNLQHELKCTTLALEQKKLEVQEKQRMNKQLQQQIKAQGKPVDLAADASIGGKRKKTDIQITGQVHHEVPRRKLDDRKPIRRQSIAKAQTISSSNVQSVKAASCSGSGVSLHVERRRSTRRTSIVPNSGVHMDEATEEEDKGVNTDVDMIIPICAIKAEPETEPEITEPLLTQNEMTNDEFAVSCLKSSSLSTEQQVAADAMDGPCPSIVPVATAQLTAQDVHQEAPWQKLGNSSISTGDALDGPHPSVVPVATAPLTTQDVHQEAPRQKLGDSSLSTGDALDVPHPSVVPVATTPLTAQDVHQEAPRQKLGDRKSIRRRSIATVHAVSSSHVQSVKTASCSGSNVPLHEEGRKSTRRRSIRPSSGTQMEEAVTDSCKIADYNNANTINNNITPICTVNSEPNTEHGTRWLPIKEENTDVSDFSSVLIPRVATDATSGPHSSLTAARRTSLSRPLPLRRAVEKVGSYRERPVNVKMRRVD